MKKQILFLSIFLMAFTSATIINFTKTNVRCYGKNSGKLSASVDGVNTPYTYQWSTGETSQAIENLYAGTYTITVTDVEGFTFTKSSTLTQNPALICVVYRINDFATASATGGVPPYAYLWDTSPLQTNSTATGLNPINTYRVKVTDSKNCTKVISF
jgi:hypothetical protein